MKYIYRKRVKINRYQVKNGDKSFQLHFGKRSLYLMKKKAGLRTNLTGAITNV